MPESFTAYLSPGGQFLTQATEKQHSATTTPMHAADLLTIVATGNGQDVVDALEAMIAQHGEFLTRLMMRSVADRLDAEKLVYLTDWDIDCEPMQWTPEEANT